MLHHTASLLRRPWAALSLVLATLLGGCAAFSPGNVTLSQAELQRQVERQFPREQRLLEVIDLQFARPVVRLLPERNRIATEMDVTAGERLSGRTLRGNVALDYALRYEPSDMSLRLSQVRVNTLALDFAGSALPAQATRLAARAAEHALDDFTVWRADESRREQLRRAGVAGVDIAVTSHGVELRVAPAR